MLGELEKLEANLGGVADMRKQPDAIFIVDLRKEQLAVREARRLGMPVIALVDTNCDPDEADFVIPGNDDAIRSCSLIVRAVADAIDAGKQKVTVEELAANGSATPAETTEETPVEAPAAEAAAPAEAPTAVAPAADPADEPVSRAQAPAEEPAVVEQAPAVEEAPAVEAPAETAETAETAEEGESA